MKSQINRLPKSTVELNITISWDEVKAVYDRIWDEQAEKIEIKGFRKGKAPRKLVEEKIDKTELYQKAVTELIPQVYSQAIKEHDLKPIASPKIELLEARESRDWQIKVSIAEKPLVKLKNYRQALTKVKSASTKIWTPHQKQPDEKEKQKDKQKEISAVLKALLDEVEVDLPDLLVDSEVERLLARLVDDVQKLGLTVEQYLKARNLTSQDLKSHYRKQAEESLKLEFILSEIADRERITVSQKEIEEAIAKVKDEKERQNLQNQAYVLAHLLRRQKTLDSLVNP